MKLNKISLSFTNESGKNIALGVLKLVKITPIEVTDTKVFFNATLKQENRIAAELLLMTLK